MVRLAQVKVELLRVRAMELLPFHQLSMPPARPRGRESSKRSAEKERQTAATREEFKKLRVGLEQFTNMRKEENNFRSLQRMHAIAVEQDDMELAGKIYQKLRQKILADLENEVPTNVEEDSAVSSISNN